MGLIALVVLGAGLLVAVFLIVIYNRLIRLRAMVGEGWSGIEVQLKRRANLVPNLVETVKGYMHHERDLLEQVTRLRSQSMSAEGVTQVRQAETALAGGLARLFAVAEGYPELKASQNFQALQQQLSDIEDQIQMARRYYNGTVRNLNIAVASFPSNLVAGTFGFQTAEFFEIEDPADRAVPRVGF